MTAVWILGATGRTGRAVADRLAASGHGPVLVGRDAERLRSAAEPGGHETVLASTPEAAAAAIRAAGPTVVVNTIGPFAESAPAVLDACLHGGSHYVDIANDMLSVPALLEQNGAAVAAGLTFVTGAGFGVTATESVVVRLRALHPGRPPRAVRVDMVPSLALAAGSMGEALAGTVVGGIPGVPGGRRFGGRRYDGGRLRPAAVGGRRIALTTPDGDEVVTGVMPLGELVAAFRASGAPEVVAASSEAPSGRLVRWLLPVGGLLLSVGPVRRFAARRLAAVAIPERPQPRAHSWGHARFDWADGRWAEGWLELPEAQAATVAIAAEVAARLAGGDQQPGAWTPAALFGPELAESVGGRYSTSGSTSRDDEVS